MYKPAAYSFTGMIDCGMGESSVTSFLTNMNVPGMSRRGLRKRELDAGEKFVELARESCDKALLEESDLSRKRLLYAYSKICEIRPPSYMYI